MHIHNIFNLSNIQFINLVVIINRASYCLMHIHTIELIKLAIYKFINSIHRLMHNCTVQIHSNEFIKDQTIGIKGNNHQLPLPSSSSSSLSSSSSTWWWVVGEFGACSGEGLVARKHFGKCAKTAASRRRERREQGAEGVIQKEGKDSCKDTLDPLGELQDPREKSCVTGAEEELLKIAPLLENVQKLLQAGGERGESRELK